MFCDCCVVTKDTIQYGKTGGEISDNINQGNINEIKSWELRDWSNGTIMNFQWSTSNGIKSSIFGEASSPILINCIAFTLSDGDFINGYRVIYGSYVQGLAFYTFKGSEYKCIDEEKINQFTDTGKITMNNYYLSGFYIRSGDVIDQIGFQFTSINNDTVCNNESHIVYPATIYPTTQPTIMYSQSPSESRNCSNPIWVLDTSHVGERPNCPDAYGIEGGQIYNDLIGCKNQCISQSDNCNFIVSFETVTNFAAGWCYAHFCFDLQNIQWMKETRYGYGGYGAESHILVSCVPTTSPTSSPSKLPTVSPSESPTSSPSQPSITPTLSPSESPTVQPLTFNTVNSIAAIIVAILVISGIICLMVIIRQRLRIKATYQHEENQCDYIQLEGTEGINRVMRPDTDYDLELMKGK